MPRRKPAEPEGEPTYTQEQQRLIKASLDLIVADLRAKAEAAESIKDQMVTLKEAGVIRKHRAALRKHAQVIAKDGDDAAKEQLNALHDIGIIVGHDMFALAGIALPEQERAAA